MKHDLFRTARPWLVAMLTMLVALSFGPPSVFAQEDETKAAEATEKIDELKKELEEMVKELTPKYKEAKTQKERDSIIKKRRSFEAKIVKKAVRAAGDRDDKEANAKDLTFFFSKTKGTSQKLVFDALVKQLDGSKELMPLLTTLNRSRSMDKQTERMFRALVEDAKDEELEGHATLGLAGYLDRVLQTKTRGSSTGYFKSLSADKLEAEIETLLNRCVEKYADVKGVGDKAKMKLTAMMIKIGNVAPDIVGVDTDDVEFKLSDYRGKVVMVDFWGDW